MSTQGLDSINSGVEVVTGLSHGFWSMVGLCIMVGVLYPHPWAYGSMLMLLGTAWYFLWMSFVRLEKTLTSCERQLVVPHKRYVPLSLLQRVFYRLRCGGIWIR